MVERSMSTFGEDVAAGIELAAAGDGKRLSAAKRAQIIVALKANSNAAEVAKQIGGVTRIAVWKIAKVADIELTAGKAARGHRAKSTSDRSLRKRCRGKVT
jgi:hypothetical protein